MDRGIKARGRDGGGRRDCLICKVVKFFRDKKLAKNGIKNHTKVKKLIKKINNKLIPYGFGYDDSDHSNNDSYVKP